MAQHTNRNRSDTRTTTTTTRCWLAVAELRAVYAQIYFQVACDGGSSSCAHIFHFLVGSPAAIASIRWKELEVRATRFTFVAYQFGYGMGWVGMVWERRTRSFRLYNPKTCPRHFIFCHYVTCCLRTITPILRYNRHLLSEQQAEGLAAHYS